MHFTLWPSLFAPAGAHREISWESFLSFVASPQVAEDRNALEGWSPARNTGNRRGLDYVELVSCLVLDDDKTGLPLERVREVWRGVAGVIHTTHSHTPDAPRYRIVLRVSRDMTPAEFPRVWRHLRDLAAARGQVLDEAPKDPSRFWYAPGHRPGAPYAWCELDGAPLNVDAILALVPAGASAPPPSPRAEAVSAPADRRQAMATALGSAWPAKGRHLAQLALAGALRAEGWEPDEAIEFLCTVSRIAGNEDRTKREATVRHTWSRAADAPTTGWATLKQHVDPVLVDVVRGGLARSADWTEKTTRRLAEVAAAAPATSSAPLIHLPPCESVTLGGFTFNVGGFDAELPPISYQIDTLISRGDVVMLVAHGNSLKTWLALSLAHAVACGRPWLGKFMVTRGRAAIIDYESGEYEIRRRFKVLGVRDADVGDRLLRSSFSTARLIEPDTWIGLAGHGLQFLVVDSFNAAAPDLDENDARSAAMLQNAGRFAEVTSCTVVFIHHSRKGSGGDRRESVRGSTALFAACDRIYEFSDVEKKDGGAVLSTMHTVKDGAGRSPMPVRVELSDQGMRYVEIESKDEQSEETTTADQNRAFVLGLLKSRPHGVAQKDLISLMKGRREGRFELLAQLKVADIIVEFKDSAEKTIIVSLRPGIDV